MQIIERPKVKVEAKLVQLERRIRERHAKKDHKISPKTEEAKKTAQNHVDPTERSNEHMDGLEPERVEVSFLTTPEPDGEDGQLLPSWGWAGQLGLVVDDEEAGESEHAHSLQDSPLGEPLPLHDKVEHANGSEKGYVNWLEQKGISPSFMESQESPVPDPASESLPDIVKPPTKTARVRSFV